MGVKLVRSACCCQHVFVGLPSPKLSHEHHLKISTLELGSTAWFFRFQPLNLEWVFHQILKYKFFSLIPSGWNAGVKYMNCIATILHNFSQLDYANIILEVLHDLVYPFIRDGRIAWRKTYQQFCMTKSGIGEERNVWISRMLHVWNVYICLHLAKTNLWQNDVKCV